MKTTLKITGMHCASCKTLIEDVCKDVSGVQSCEVDMASSLATVEHDDTLDVEKLKQEIAALGEYRVEQV